MNIYNCTGYFTGGTRQILPHHPPSFSIGRPWAKQKRKSLGEDMSSGWDRGAKGGSMLNFALCVVVNSSHFDSFLSKEPYSVKFNLVSGE
jgi:hypothetical protein